MVIQVMQHFGLDPRTMMAIGMFFWFLFQRMSVATTDELELLLAETVRKCLFNADITEEQAALKMRIDVSQFRRQLRCDPKAHLSLNRMLRLPYKSWLLFGPVLMWIVAKKRFDEIARDLRVAEADIPTTRAAMAVMPARGELGARFRA